MSDNDNSIRPDTRVTDVLSLFPETLPVFKILGFRGSCGTCKRAGPCTVESAACAGHQSPADVANAVLALNAAKKSD